MSDSPTEPLELADIAAALDGVGADLASLRARSSGDAFVLTSAYAALLAARGEVSARLDGLPTPRDETSDDIDIPTLAQRLNNLVDQLALYARTHDGPTSLACARAALHADDAWSHLASESS